MSKQRQKRIDKLDYNLKIRLFEVVKNITSGDFDVYDIKKLVGFPNLFRIRIGDIRIVFEIINGKGNIKKIDFRGDVYK